MVHPATPLTEAAILASEARAAGRIVVTTNGCFDLIHAGHLDTLQGAKALGDLLFVLINSDASVKKFKGPSRPYLEEADRAALLAALRPVDRVVIFDEDTPLTALAVLKPQVHVKGGSYLPERIAAERDLIASWGGRLECLPLRPGRSSSDLIRRIREDRPDEPDPRHPP